MTQLEQQNLIPPADAKTNRHAAGDKQAFRMIVEQYKRPLYYYALKMTGHHQDAEDLSQEVFIKAFRSMDQFKGDDTSTVLFKSWLYKIALNTHLNRRRKKSVSQMVLQENIENDQASRFENASQSPEKVAQSKIAREHINKAMQKLSPRERSVFILRHDKDLKLSDVAKSLEMTEGSVKSLLFRAVRKMREQLAFYRPEYQSEGGLKL